ncbi:hypothetical protein C5B76_21780 [Aeromonas salmonicida]|nr:hypothetical protein C5B76_21780 [Aeromonas salmonicida]
MKSVKSGRAICRFFYVWPTESEFDDGDGRGFGCVSQKSGPHPGPKGLGGSHLAADKCGERPALSRFSIFFIKFRHHLADIG